MMLDLIREPWPWYVAGPLITLTMFLLLWYGRRFGISSSLQHMCAIGGAGKFSEYFRCNWKSNIWNLTFILGTIIGGWISVQFLMADYNVELGAQTIERLQNLGIQSAGENYIPVEIFDLENMLSLKTLIILLGGGFLVGFGARYADGCTSGHAISGLSNLQLPSLIAVIGFFIGGLIMTHLLLPFILQL